MLPAGLLVVHDTGRGGEDDEAELTGGKELGDPLLELVEADVVAGADDTALVEAISRESAAVRRVFLHSPKMSQKNIPAVELDNDLAVAVVIDLLELANVAWEKKRISMDVAETCECRKTWQRR